jgi:hypothetical protein
MQIQFTYLQARKGFTSTSRFRVVQKHISIKKLPETPLSICCPSVTIAYVKYFISNLRTVKGTRS